MDVVFKNTDQIGPTPALVDRDTGRISLNMDVWPNLTPLQQEAVLQHEAGHYLRQDPSEYVADGFAIDELTKKYGPKESASFFRAFADLLDTGAHDDRLTEIGFRLADNVDKAYDNEGPRKEIKRFKRENQWNNSVVKVKESSFRDKKDDKKGLLGKLPWHAQQRIQSQLANPPKQPTVTRYILDPYEQLQSGLSKEEYAVAKLRMAEKEQHGTYGTKSKVQMAKENRSTKLGALAGSKLAQIAGAALLLGALVYLLYTNIKQK